MRHFAQILSYGLLNGALYGLVALGLSLVFGVMNYLMVAHGALIMLAAYVTFWAFFYTHLDPFIALIIVVPIFFVGGWILFKILFQSLMKYSEGEKIKNSLLLSFGLLLILSNMAVLFWTADERAITTQYSGKVIEISGVRLPFIGMGGLVLAIVVIIALHFFLTRTYFGKAIRAVSLDHEAATLMGINVNNMTVLAFALSAGMGALGGIVITPKTFMSYDAGAFLGLKGFVAAAAGGLENETSAVVGGLVLGLLETLAAGLLSSGYKDAIAFIVLFFILFIQASGVLRRGSARDTAGV